MSKRLVQTQNKCECCGLKARRPVGATEISATSHDPNNKEIENLEKAKEPVWGRFKTSCLFIYSIFIYRYLLIQLV
jgi:hypothetical protein